jgi:predicted peptidase
MRYSLFISLLVVIFVLCGWPAAAPFASAANPNEFAVFNLLDANNNILLPGRLYIPPEHTANPHVPRPLILFLHGSGESGTNNTSQVNANIDNLLTAAKARGAFLYAPQTQSNVGWANFTVLARALTMADRAINDYNANERRLYVTGLSLGGGGAWDFLNQFPDRVAATVPICGIPPLLGFSPENLLDEPIWAFHGRFDSNVPVAVTRDVVGAILAEAGLTPPTYLPPNTFAPHQHFDYPPLNLHYTDMRGGHGIWPEVYNNFTIDNQNLYDWMFAQSQIPEPATLLLALFTLAAASCVRPLRRKR